MKKRKGLAAVLLTVCLGIAAAMTAFAGEKFQAPARAYWDDDVMGLARWDKPENAKLYDIYLYEGEDILVQTIKDHAGTRLDLSPYMQDGSIYHFKVRAVPKKSQKTYEDGEWAESEEITASGVGSNDGRWRTYLTGRKYQNDDGSYAGPGWQQIAARWYYFNADQYAVTGWQQIGGVWYYFENSGIMVTGWQEIDGAWYYLKESGAMATGWQETRPGSWYYLGENGAMLTNCVVEGHHLNESGLRID